MLKTNKMNKMNSMKVEVVNGQIVKSEVKNTSAAKRNETNISIIANQIRNRKRTTKAKALKLATVKVSEMLKGDKTNFMALAYSEKESQVGMITNNMATICSITRQSWENEDGSINKDLFYRAFICCDKKNPGTKDHWDPIFTEDEPSLTKGLRLKSYVEMVYDVYYISNIEIARFRNQLIEMDVDKMTYDDIKMIQSDLYHLFRAYQESSIDETKDKSKTFKIKWDEIIGFVPRMYSTHPDDYKHNLEEVMKDRTIEYEIQINTREDAALIRNDILCDALAEVHEDFITEEVIATAEDSVTDLMREVIGTSENMATEDKLHCESLISVVAASFKTDDKLSKEEYKAIRDALYTVVSNYADDVEEATAIILDLIAAKYRVNFKGELVRNNDIAKMRLGCAKMILGGILPLYINNKETYTRIFDHKEFTMFQDLEDGQRFEIEDGDIIADGVLVGCLNFDNDTEEEICAITTDAAYVIDGQLYIEQNIYEDIDCDVNTVVIETLYKEATKAEVQAGEVNDNYGRDTYVEMVDNNITITGRKHNVLIMEDANGARHIRGKLNAHSAALLEGENTLEVTTENSIAIHVPYDPEIDDVEYCCEVVVFC